MKTKTKRIKIEINSIPKLSLGEKVKSILTIILMFIILSLVYILRLIFWLTPVWVCLLIWKVFF